MKKIISDTRVPVKIWTDDIEPEAEQQLRNLANMKFVFKHVAAMPDVHKGNGSTIGSVFATKGHIIPAAIGVDIGCGMAAVKMPFKIDRFEKLAELRHSLERSIPVGHNSNKEVTERMNDYYKSLGETSNDTKMILEKYVNKSAFQIGTLGGGNHFIELCQDQNGDAWLMLHSGSRNIGKVLADFHISRAKGLMKDYFIELPDPNLAFLTQGTKEFKDYIHDLMWAQRYAKFNRNEMLLRALKDISYHLFKEEKDVTELIETRVDCHHNYTAIENHFGSNVYVTRKGAVSAKIGELGIIPGSMGTKSYIVAGKGEAESFCSCSHGAGRRMSRTKARELYTEADLVEATEGIECRKDKAVLDEIPASYKNIDEVMSNQKDLVDVKYVLKQLLCVKGG